jgi:hypothetical protein
MGINEKGSTLVEVDELLHQPSSELKWRESYYFNWADLKNNRDSQQ